MAKVPTEGLLQTDHGNGDRKPIDHDSRNKLAAFSKAMATKELHTCFRNDS